MPAFRNLEELFQSTLEVLKPPERLSVSEAAEKHRYVNQPGAYVGPWYNKTVPYMTEVMDTLSSREHNACVFVGPAQTGKTDALLVNWILHSVICDPADMIIYQTAQGVAHDFSKRRVDRLHRHSRAVGARLLPGKSADNVFTKLYKGGNMLTLSWPSINEMSGRPVGKVALTDLDRMPTNVDGEGSPFDLARKRTTTFGSYAMTVAESSPGFECTDTKWVPDPKRPHLAPPAEGIVSLYNRGDRRRWLWPCPHCRHWFEAEFAHLTWVDSTDILECAESAVMGCPNCGGVITPQMKAEVNRKGKWIKEGQTIDTEGVIHGEGIRSDIASFWMKGVAAAFSSWKTLVINTLKAEEEFQRTASEEALKTTINTDRGEVYVPKHAEDHRSPEDLQARAEDLGETVVPYDARFLVATVDVQKSHFVVQVHGIGAGLDIFVIDRFNIYKSERFDEDGDRQYLKPAAYKEDWDLLTEQVLNKTYPLADGSGRRMSVKAMGYDTGGLKGVTANAYAYYRKQRKLGNSGRVFPLKGNSSPTAPRAITRYPDTGRSSDKEGAKGEIPVLMIGTNSVKDSVDALLDRTEPGGGMIHFAHWLPDNFYSELCAEVRNEKGKWENPGKLRNESFDLLTYCFAILLKMRADRFNWDAAPAWAADWASGEENSLIFTNDSGPRFQKTRKTDLKSLAALLG